MYSNRFSYLPRLDRNDGEEFPPVEIADLVVSKAWGFGVQSARVCGVLENIYFQTQN